MVMNNPDKDWETFGASDPYWAVITDDRYRTKRIDGEAIKSFFNSGEEYVVEIFRDIHEGLDREFRPIKVVDFGCGVGRITIPLSRICKVVLAIDVADSMLEEAEKNCLVRNIKNVRFVKSDDQLSNVKGKYDFIHSFIVFQHIPPRRGERIFERLVAILNDGGVGAIHFTYFKRASKLSKVIGFLGTKAPFGAKLINLLQKRKINSPIMQMNDYNVNTILRILQENNCHKIHLRFTQHSRHYGVIVFFQKTVIRNM